MGGCMMLYISCMRGETWSTLFHILSPCFNGKAILFTMSLCSGAAIHNQQTSKRSSEQVLLFSKDVSLPPYSLNSSNQWWTSPIRHVVGQPGKLLVGPFWVRGAATAFCMANDLMVIDTLWWHRSVPKDTLRWHMMTLKEVGMSMLRVSPFLQGGILILIVWWDFPIGFSSLFSHRKFQKTNLGSFKNWLGMPFTNQKFQHSKAVSTHLWNLYQQATFRDYFHGWRTGVCRTGVLYGCLVIFLETWTLQITHLERKRINLFSPHWVTIH